LNRLIKNLFERLQKSAVATLFIVYILFNFSCQTKSDDPKSLKGTKWKLAGIVDTETGDLKVIEPKNCERCYTFTFDTDSTASGNSITNILLVSLRPVLHFKIATYALDCHDSDCALFYEAIESIVCYKLDEKGLKFYFDDQKKYLLFKTL